MSTPPLRMNKFDAGRLPEGLNGVGSSFFKKPAQIIVSPHKAKMPESMEIANTL